MALWGCGSWGSGMYSLPKNATVSDHKLWFGTTEMYDSKAVSLDQGIGKAGLPLNTPGAEGNPFLLFSVSGIPGSLLVCDYVIFIYSK